MSLDFSLTKVMPTEVFSQNITHNLGRMAEAAGIYEALWRPEEIGAKHAQDIVPILERGLRDLRAKPEYYEKFNAKNGWGMYEHFVPFVASVLEACQKHPTAIIEISR